MVESSGESRILRTCVRLHVCSVTVSVSCLAHVTAHWAAGTTGLMQAMMELRSLRATTGVPPAGFLSM